MRSVTRMKRVLDCINRSSKVITRRGSVWSADGVLTSPYDKVEIPKSTLYDYVWENLDKWPEKTLAVCSETGRGYTYEQAFNLSNAFAANLRLKLKIRDGDTVAVMLPNVPDFPLVAMGILGAGGVISTINPVYTAEEVQRQLVMSKAKAVITMTETIQVIRDSLKLAKLNIPIIVVKTSGTATPEGALCFNELSEDVHVDKSCLKEVRRSHNDICFMPYSSGTTGLPKGVELSNKNLVANCQQMNAAQIRNHEDTTASHQDTVMGVLPFFHIYGASVIVFHKMSVGVKIVTMGKFQPDHYLKSLVKFKAEILYTAPPIVMLMRAHPAGTAETYKYLKVIMNGAAPIGATDIEGFLEKVKRKIDFRQAYGLTETSPVVILPPIMIDNYQTVGHPASNTEVKIVDENLKALGPNEPGELLIKGPQVMRGYRDNPKANSEAFTSDGWFKSGDVAVFDDKGLITIKDRLKELIKVKGYQVPPAELEAVLREHPAVIDAAVIGVPHAVTGEAPKAFVVLKPGQTAEAKAISDFVKAKVAPFKRVDDITFLDSIPKTAAGKILRKALKDKYT